MAQQLIQRLDPQQGDGGKMAQTLQQDGAGQRRQQFLTGEENGNPL
jgi:hypothetical protein